jgi:histidine ammonia-lyase
VRGVLETEATAHGQPAHLRRGRARPERRQLPRPAGAQALDLLAIACADLGAISERRIARLVDPALSGSAGLPHADAGVNSG